MGAAPVLTILKNGETIKSQPLEGEALLGRSEDCVIRLDDRAISRQHAVFRPTAGGVQVERKSEVAPLSVNGTECTSALVKEGDVISIGPYLMKLSMASAEAQEKDEKGLAPESVIEVPAIEDAIQLTQATPPEAQEPVQTQGQSESSMELDSSQPILTNDVSLGTPSGTPSISLEAQVETPHQNVTPEFSMSAQAPEGSEPIDLGAIMVDEDAKTKIVPHAKVSAKLILPPEVANVTELEITKDEITIGREKDCDVVLNDKKASRKHAVIRRTGMRFTVKDLGSANGTYVDGVKITEQELSGDDILRIGNTEFRFLALSSEYAENQNQFIPVPPEAAEEPQFTYDPLAGSNGFAGTPLSAPVPEGVAADPNPSPAAARAAAATAGIAGLAGIGGVTGGKKTLLEKFKAQPRPRQVLIVLVVGLFLWWFNSDDGEVTAPAKKPAVVSKAPGKAAATFESLSPEQKKFVESQHALAFDYYKNREYDKALFEIDKIFALIPDYKDSREIERYAKEGKRKLEALEEEKRKKEEEEKLKLKVAELVDQAKTYMESKQYDKVDDLFSQILALDPDNQEVAQWRRDVDKFQEDRRIKEQEKSVQEQINLRAWDLYREGIGLKRNGKYHDAIDSFKRVTEIGALDKKVNSAAARQIKTTEALIGQLRDPVLAEAKDAENSQDFAKAYKLYKKATEIDPPHPAGYAGMNRVRGVLHDRAKGLYIEAVLAESYSDFDTAKKKYQECKDTAPTDDIYYERAERKLATFFRPREDQIQ